MFLRPHDLISLLPVFVCCLPQLHLGWCRESIYHFLIFTLRRLFSPACLFGCRQALEVPLSGLDVVRTFLRFQMTRTVFNEHAAAVSGFVVFSL